MTGGQTKNSALVTTLAFHYQVLIGVQQCFEMQEAQSVWFERDGDVSLVGTSSENSIQIEVKNYADSLTDHHENLWKTLKNWLAEEFDHTKYSSLVLHTTQPFGANSTLSKWNEVSAEDRLKILSAIYATRTKEELTAKKPTPIVLLQKIVMATEASTLEAVLKKVVLFTEADDAPSITKKIISYLSGIPKNNVKSYLHGVIGFIYDSASALNWEICKAAFDEKCLELTSTYCRKRYTIPAFKGHEATDEELKQHGGYLFVKKITDIDHHEVIPDAVGNWIELQNSLLAELDGYPAFRDKTMEYRAKLIKRFKLKHNTATLSSKSPAVDSKIFYNETIVETPINLESDTPPIEYRNGLIHDAMDDEDENLRWRIDP